LHPAKLPEMNDFTLWFTTGLEHIADWNGYDHILFLLVLCAGYSPAEWRKILILITAFTVGHSLTLALSALHIFTIRSGITEFLIPVTILFTAVVNLVRLRRPPAKRGRTIYLMALVFGCIHGMGFSYLLLSMLGDASAIAGPLFAFNLGLEAGQLIIVAGVLAVSLFLSALIRIQPADKTFFISSAVFGIAFIMMLERFNALLTSQ
jgi:hypothetical protein